MNFETVLFAAAFLLLAIMSLTRNETPVDQSASDENSNALEIAKPAPGDDGLISPEAEVSIESQMDKSTKAQGD